MKVMVLVKASAASEAGALPHAELLEAMGKFNQELINAGVLLAADGLKSSAFGKRVRFSGTHRTILAACHARTPTAAATNWEQIVALYDALAQVMPSPVVELNRAVAVSMAFGPAAALELVNTLTGESRLKNYHLLPSVRGDLLEKLGRHDEARVEFTRAAGLTHNARERSLLLGRAAACGSLAQ